MKPIFCVCGPTGVGKSALALKLAQKLRGTIINADAMQVYKSVLPITTNKPTAEEYAGAPHLLFDFIDIGIEYTVKDYLVDGISAIHQVHNEGRIPILAGGTNYYVQSLLFPTNLPSTSTDTNSSYVAHESLSFQIANEIKNILYKTDPKKNNPTSIKEYCEANDIHKILMTVDEEMGNRWHPQDYRKIRRSLEVYYRTGQKHSQYYKENDEKIQFRTCLIWLYGDPSKLDSRLDSRVDQMIEKGMYKEIHDLLEACSDGSVIGADPKTGETNYTRGILQAIGFKEFREYFELSKQNANSENLKKAWEQGVEETKLATRQYSRRQLTWLRNRLVPLLNNQPSGSCAVILVDATDPADIEMQMETILEAASKFLDGSLAEKKIVIGSETLLPLLEKPVNSNEWKIMECPNCTDAYEKNTIIHGEEAWKIHLKSNKHKRALQRIKVRESNQYWIKQKKEHAN